MDLVSFGCCLLAFVLYYNSLEAGFVYDDRRAILTNPDVVSTNSWMNIFWNDFWGTPLSDTGSHGSYRPLCVLSFRLNHLLGGFQPWGYHLVNVLLHCLATGLVVRVARKIFPPPCIPVGATVTGLLFATHPIHTEAVAGIVGRADLAACNFYLLSFLAYVAHLKYREQRCVTQDNSTLPNELCVCCKSHHNRVEKKRKDKQRLSLAAPGNSNLMYQNITVNIPQPGANRNWRNRIIRCNVIVRGGNMFSNMFRAGGVRVGSDNVPSSVNNGVASEIASICACKSDGERCGWRRIKQWMAMMACVALAFAAVLCKETGITVLVVCALYDVSHISLVSICKRQLRSVMMLGVALCTMLLLRLQIAGGTTPSFATADNPTARERSLLTRFLTFSYLPTFNFQLLLCPVTLSFDWSMDALPRITTICDIRNCISLIFYYILYRTIKLTLKKIYQRQLSERKSSQKPKRVRRKRSNTTELKSSVGKSGYWHCPVCHHVMLERHSVSCRVSNNNNMRNSHYKCICQPTQATSATTLIDTSLRGKPCTLYVTILISLAFLTLPFLPATNLFFYVGFVVAERVLYLPSVGYCLLLGLGFSRIHINKYHLRTAYFGLLLVLLAFSLRTIKRNNDWLNEENLYASAVTVNPPKAYGNLGTILSGLGRVEEAEWAYKQALEHRGNMADVHYNLGNLLQGSQKYGEAIESYEKAIQFRPSLALAYVNLGVVLVAVDRFEEAETVLKQGAALDGTGLKDQRTHENARLSAFIQLAALYTGQGNLHKALATYKEAVKIMPPYYPPQNLYNLIGETLTSLQRFADAEKWFQAALEAEPDHVPAHITYGKLLAKNNSRIAEAEQWFRRAQKLAPSDASVYHHYGEFLVRQRRHTEAAVHYVRAAELDSDNFELAVAAATALREADEKTKAEEWYRRASEMSPLDPRGHTNLGAMLHINGKYTEAAECYREALRLEPDDVTTVTNLHKLNNVMA